MGLAIATLAQEQMQFERRLDKTDTTVQETAVAVDGLQKRVQELEIRISQFENVMSWLNEWYQRLANEDLPF